MRFFTAIFYLLLSAQIAWSENQKVFDLSEFSLVDFDQLNYQLFNVPPSVTPRDTGNPFKDKREFKEEVQKFKDEAERKFADVNVNNVTFRLGDLPLQIRDYSFSKKHFPVCVPGFWNFTRSVEKKLRFLGQASSILRCQEHSPVEMSAGSPALSQFFGPQIFLTMEDDAVAERVFNSLDQASDVRGNVFCGAPLKITKSYPIGSWTLSCQIRKVDILVSRELEIHWSLSSGKTQTALFQKDASLTPATTTEPTFSPAITDAIHNWVEQQTEVRQAVVDDCNCVDDLKYIWQAYDNREPYIVVADLNEDGEQDVAFVTVSSSDKLPKVWNGRNIFSGWNANITILNGDKAGGFKLAFQERFVGAPSSSILFYDKQRNILTFGAWESSATIVRPSDDTYRLEF